MGMLDGILGNALGGILGGSAQQQNPLMQVALQLLQQNGGIEGVLDKFRQGGYADQADSWQAAGGLAQMLPQRIDKFTPDGEVPDNQNDLVAQALALLTKSKVG